MVKPRQGSVVVIRLGALGDFCLSFGPFAAIRAYHPTARITLLTTAPYADLARAAPWFTDVAVDSRPRFWQIGRLWALARILRGRDIIYDLQTSGRSTRYFWLAGQPAWSGIGACRRFPHRDRGRNAQHTIERQQGQLRAAGITHFPIPDTHWLATAAAPPVPLAYALLAPGASAHRPEKRWPAQHFAVLAAHLAAQGLTPIIVGTAGEADLAATIRAAAPSAIDLTGQTDLLALASLAAGARHAIGNDTGPMHLAAAVGCPCVVLFGAASDPALTAPRGPDGAWPTILRADRLADLTPAAVIAALGRQSHAAAARSGVPAADR